MWSQHNLADTASRSKLAHWQELDQHLGSSSTHFGSSHFGSSHLAQGADLFPKNQFCSFSFFCPAFTIFVLFGEFFLGGVLRCRAPAVDGAHKGSRLSEFTGLQQQCAPRGHCSAEAPKSGIVGSAGHTAECKRNCEDTSMSNTCSENQRRSGLPNRRFCMKHQEKQQGTSERSLHQGDHSGRLVSACGTIIRGIPSGRYWCLPSHAKRSRRGDSLAAVRRGTGYPHDKTRIWIGRGRIRSQDSSGPVNNAEAILGTTGNCSRHVPMLSAARRVCGGRHCTSGGRFPHTALSRRVTALTRPKSATAHWLLKLGVAPVVFFNLPDPEGSKESKWSRASRGTVSRRYFAEAGSLVSSPAPSTSKVSHAGTWTSRSQTIPISRRLCGKRRQLGLPSWWSPCAARGLDCVRGSATSRVLLVMCTQWRTPGGSSGRDGRQSICLSRRASIPNLLALHSGSVLLSRKDQEGHDRINGATSSKQIAARLWVRAHPTRGTTQTPTSTCPGLVKAGKDHCRGPESYKNLGKHCPRRPKGSHNKRPSIRLASSCCEMSLRRKRVEGHEMLRCHLLHPGSELQPCAYTDLSRQGRKGWMPCNLRNSQCWQILPRSSWCSWRRCSRLRQQSGSSEDKRGPSRPKSRR